MVSQRIPEGAGVVVVAVAVTMERKVVKMKAVEVEDLEDLAAQVE